MIVINLIGPPSCGKSTTATHVYSRLKLKGYTLEYVPEYAKIITYRQHYKILENQLYVTSKQHKTLDELKNYGVPLVITDSPLSLGKYYGRNLPYYKEYCTILDHLNAQFVNYNVYINRVKDYNKSGRTQSEEESDSIGRWLAQNLPIDHVINGDGKGAETLAIFVEDNFLNI